MKALKKTVLIVVLGLAAGGCSMMERSKPATAAIGHEDLKNAQGHVVGYKDMIRNAETGEEIAQISLFLPRTSGRGEILGYEEKVPGGSVLRDVNGKRIGMRLVDARSRGTNPQSKGLLIVVHGKQSDRFTTAHAPDIDELKHLARLN